jgi:hypothetical protein
MKKYLVVMLLLICVTFRLDAQDSTRIDDSTTEEKIALTAMTGIIIPLAIAGTVISVIPPAISFVTKDGINYGALNLESGIGIGKKRETGIFSDWRAGVSYSHIFSSRIRDIYRAEVKRDFNFAFIDRRMIWLSGFHVSAGLLTDFPNDGFTVGAGAWAKSPWLSYFGFFPQHTVGFTYRYNKYFGGSDFHEITMGMTSSFTF